MAMSAAAMADNIVTNLEVLSPDITPNRAFYVTQWTAICQGIIDDVTSAVTEVVIGTGSSAGTYEGTITS